MPRQPYSLARRNAYAREHGFRNYYDMRKFRSTDAYRTVVREMKASGMRMGPAQRMVVTQRVRDAQTRPGDPRVAPDWQRFIKNILDVGGSPRSILPLFYT